jgi:ferrous iron transport protein B
MKLSDLSEGEKGYILKIKGRGKFRQRIMEMGFVAGKEVVVVKKAPLKDPVEYKIMGYHVSLRNSEALLIEISREEENGSNISFESLREEEHVPVSWQEKSKNIQIALVGNPNSGKTTLFNFASGLKEKVGNYAGVTVDSKEAKYSQSGYTFSIVDLPGTYSLKSYNPEEIFVRNFIFDNLPDVVVNIIDGSNLERNLYLTTQLIDMGVQMVIAINMFDELEKTGNVLDYVTLGKMIGVPIVPTISSKGKGIHELFEKVIEVYEGKEPDVRHVHVNYGDEIENAVATIQTKIKREENLAYTNIFSSRYLAIELLENDKEYSKNISRCSNSQEIIETAAKEVTRLVKHFNEPVESVITDLRYGFIAGALNETMKLSIVEKKRKSDQIDRYLTHKYLGIPIFIFFMWLTFFTTFAIGSYPKSWLEGFTAYLSSAASNTFPAGLLRDFFIDGIVGGVGSVIVFLPNIIILFLFISLMEDTGYMARAVFIMDKVMHKIGLHGKSFIPLLIGFGCNVPAIMATRIIESKRDRLITMLIIPFMSCSARLPVYILFISAFFAKNQGSMLFLLYLIGIIFAIVSALLLKISVFKSADMPFVMELPPYRVPTLRSISKHMWSRTKLYIKKIGSIILIASIIIWALSYFPRNVRYSKNYSAEITRTEDQYRSSIDNLAGNNPEAKQILEAQKNEKLNELLLEQKGEHQSQSFLGSIGRYIEPAMKPLGFDWKMSVSVLSGLAAKEIVVSTMGVLYQTPDNAHAQKSLVAKIQNQTDSAGRKIFSPLVAFCFMLFVLIYFPCIGVIAAIKREANTWLWALFTVVYTTCSAWIITFLVYQIGNLFF